MFAGDPGCAQDEGECRSCLHRADYRHPKVAQHHRAKCAKPLNPHSPTLFRPRLCTGSNIPVQIAEIPGYNRVFPPGMKPLWGNRPAPKPGTGVFTPKTTHSGAVLGPRGQGLLCALRKSRSAMKGTHHDLPVFHHDPGRFWKPCTSVSHKTCTGYLLSPHFHGERLRLRESFSFHVSLKKPHSPKAKLQTQSRPKRGIARHAHPVAGFPRCALLARPAPNTLQSSQSTQVQPTAFPRCVE